MSSSMQQRQQWQAQQVEWKKEHEAIMQQQTEMIKTMREIQKPAEPAHPSPNLPTMSADEMRKQQEAVRGTVLLNAHLSKQI